MADKKYTAKQLRLTNEEILEKFAVYGAEVDSCLKRQQSFDRILDNVVTRQWKTESNHEERIAELERAFKILCMVLSATCVITIVLLWIF